LLKGEFQGKARILVDAVKNEEGKVRHLKFQGVAAGKPAEPATSAAGGSAPNASKAN
jgi:hypothetical protein